MTLGMHRRPFVGRHLVNWYINGMVFTSTTAGKPKNFISFSKKVEIEFWLVIWLVLKCWITYIYITMSGLHRRLFDGRHLVETSMDRYLHLRVLQHGNTKIWFPFQKNIEIEFWLAFWLMPKCWNHHSFVDISPTAVIDTSMNLYSQVIKEGNLKILLRIPDLPPVSLKATTNFELWVEIFLCADMFPYEDSKTVSVCLSVCPYPEKRGQKSP